MSQWGEIEDINLVRDKETNKSMGFAFVKYEDQRSTILAVDNFNGVKLLGRVLRCDHVQQYKLPKELREREEQALEEDIDRQVVVGPGHAYKGKELSNEFDISKGVDLWAPLESGTNESEDDVDRDDSAHQHKRLKHSKDRKHSHHHRHHSRRSCSSSTRLHHDRDRDRERDRESDSAGDRHIERDHSGDRSDGRHKRGDDAAVVRDTVPSRSDVMRQQSSSHVMSSSSSSSSRSNVLSGGSASWRGRLEPTSSFSGPRAQPSLHSTASHLSGLGGMQRRR